MDFEKCTFIVNYYSILIALWGSPAIKMRNSQKLHCNGTHTVNGLIIFENWRQQGETDFQYNPQFELENGRLWKGIFVWPGIEISAEESSHETLHSFSSYHSTMCSQKLGTFFFPQLLKKRLSSLLRWFKSNSLFLVDWGERRASPGPIQTKYTMKSILIPVCTW